MDNQQLKDVMLFHLEKFNDEGVTVNEDTVHETVLSATDGFGPANSKNIYRAFMRWTFKRRKMEDKPWPKDWMKNTVAELASKLIIFLMLLLPFTAKSQLEVTVGASKTELRDNAVTIGITYLKSFDSIWQNNDYLFAWKKSLFALTPEVNMQTGTQDAFSYINLKMTGLFMTFKTIEVSGVETPNSGKTFNTFPVAIGVETNNLFNNINGIVEAGWVPWYQNATNSTLIRNTKFGVFIQGGYKFHINSDTTAGGGKDESEELPEKSILRAKGSFGIDTKSIINVNGLKVGLVGNADLWYDLVNSATYYRIEGRGRFFLDAERYIDFIYQKGSGAPNFNEGDQYGVGLTVTF